MQSEKDARPRQLRRLSDGFFSRLRPARDRDLFQSLGEAALYLCRALSPDGYDQVSTQRARKNRLEWKAPARYDGLLHGPETRIRRSSRRVPARKAKRR